MAEINSMTDTRPETYKPEPTAPHAHFAAVDGLRAVACLAVVSFHCFFYGGGNAWPQLHLGNTSVIPTHFLAYGYLGVELFFVLSGFCLAYPLLKQSGRSSDWKRYFQHRAQRIYPAYWGALILLGALAAVISHFRISPLLESHVLMLPSFRRLCLSIINPETDLNGSFWTLKVELRWYLLLPLLLLLHRQIKSPGLMIVAIAVSLAYQMTVGRQSDSRIGLLLSPLPLFLPIFVAGIWIAELFAKDSRTHWEKMIVRNARWGLLFSLVLVWLVTPAPPVAAFHYNRIVPGGLLACFLLLLALYDPRIKQVLSWRPLVLVGLFSYSLYLIHQPLVELAYAAIKPLGWPAFAQFIFFQVIVFSACVLLGYLFYRVAEKPFLRRTSRRAVGAVPLAVAAQD